MATVPRKKADLPKKSQKYRKAIITEEQFKSLAQKKVLNMQQMKKRGPNHIFHDNKFHRTGTITKNSFYCSHQLHLPW